MSKASRQTFLEQLNNGNLEQNGVAILAYIKAKGRISTFELRNEMVYPHQTLTSRLTVLLDFGLIKIVDTVTKEVNGRKTSCSIYEFVDSVYQQVTLENQRHYEKAQKWLKSANKYKGVLNIEIYHKD